MTIPESPLPRQDEVLDEFDEDDFDYDFDDDFEAETDEETIGLEALDEDIAECGVDSSRLPWNEEEADS